jgi:hypothetical protein
MNIQLTFKNIIDNPLCKVYINDEIKFQGPVEQTISFDHYTTASALRIQFYDKMPEDTIVENGVIIRDKSFELEKIIIDNYDIQELIWQSNYLADNGETYPGCLFFGPTGSFILNFHLPILHWILELRNEPGWQDDYNYYQNACKLLTQI